MPKALNVVLIAFTGFLWGASPLSTVAQDSQGRENDTPREVFFKQADIDFWGTGAKKIGVAPASSRKEPAGGPDLHETVFAEPVQMPDGRYAIYLPPRPVLEFLENPTREGARAYLDWQDARSRKIAAALELLEAVKQEVHGGAGRTHTAKLRLTYFRQSG